MHPLKSTLLGGFFAAVALHGYAQTPEPTPESTPEPAPGSTPESADRERPTPRDEEPVQKEMPGDVLILESGSRMTGVQVLRATPQFYEVQVLDGVLIEIPRRRVKDVIYDDVDPSRQRLKNELFPEQQEVEIAPGERVTSALRDKLMSPVSAESLSYSNSDFADVLEELKTTLDLNLRVHPSIRELPLQDRRWTIEIPAGRSLLAYLREDLVGAFDFVDVIFETERIIVLTKDAAAKRAAAAAKKDQEATQDPPPPQ